MNKKEFVKDFYGKIIGSIETDYQGNKIVRDFYGRQLGRYIKKQDLTRDFYGRIVARGDQCAMLLSQARR